MANKEQTAVMWLIEHLPQIDWNDPWYRTMKQAALKLEWTQIMDARVLDRGTLRRKDVLKAMKYYSERYGEGKEISEQDSTEIIDRGEE